jgi:hypothetical protein
MILHAMSATSQPMLAPVTSTALSEIPVHDGISFLVRFAGRHRRRSSPRHAEKVRVEAPFSFAQVRSSADELLVHVPRTAQRAGGGRTPSLGGLIGDRLRLHVRPDLVKLAGIGRGRPCPALRARAGSARRSPSRLGVRMRWDRSRASCRDGPRAPSSVRGRPDRHPACAAVDLVFVEALDEPGDLVE